VFTQRSVRLLTVTAVLGSLIVSGCGRDPKDQANKPASKLVITTPAGTKPVGPIVWATYRDVQTLDPLYTFDYPDNTAISLMCESLLRTQPDGSITAGLAELTRPDATTMVFEINPAAKFWDGAPVTAEDVAYSLERQMDPNLGGFYGSVFARVGSIVATGPRQVTVTLNRPDYWIDGELASMPGIVVEKKFAEAKGENYGTSSGGVMCTGAYRFVSWSSATGVVARAFSGYWNPAVTPLTEQIAIKGVPDESTLTYSLLTGEVAGSYIPAVSTLHQLEASDQVSVSVGPGYNTDALVISNLDGVFKDVRVRRALSLAVDRQGLIDTAGGTGQLPRWFSNEGTFGYAKPVFEEAYAKAPEMTQDLTQAKKLIDEAGAAGKTITIGMSSEIPDINADAIAYQAAGQAIGLKVTFKAVSAENYINFFTDPKVREEVDAFPTVTYGDYADPASLLSSIVLPGGVLNYSGFEDKQITDWMNQAQGTADPDARAQLMVKVEDRFNELLPWIPTVQAYTLLAMNNKVTGAVGSFAYMTAPWADHLGGR